MKGIFRAIILIGMMVLCPFSLLAGDSITVKGSDTMIILAGRWAELYMKAHPDVTIQVTGGGSGTGIAALINGTTTLATASRAIKPEEVEKVKKQGTEPKEFKVALDALAVVVNKELPIEELTLKQVMGIYIGRYNDWKELGGPKHQILRYTREANSGTYVFFKEHILGGRDYAVDCQAMPGTSAVAEAVAKDKWAIGFGGIAYFVHRPELKILKIKKDETSPGVSPLNPDNAIDFDAVWSGSYPIARTLYMYSLGEPKGKVKEYIDWILSVEGQQVAVDMGYIPVKKETSQETKK